MNYNQVNLSEIIFTQKEQETIQKDYISRLEKLKKTRLRKETTNKSYMEQKKDSIPHNTTTFDEDYLFTEHDLDTKED